MPPKSRKGAPSRFKTAQERLEATYLALLPLTVFLWTMDKLCITRNLLALAMPLWLHIDATGAIFEADWLTGRPVHYSVMANGPGVVSPIKGLPLAQLITCDHSTHSIQHWLDCWRSKFFNNFKKTLDHFAIVTDFSWALLQAACRSFNFRGA
jgi:hypothetical protein